MTQDLRHQEINNIINLLKDIEDTEPDKLLGQFEYRMKDTQEQHRIASKVAEDYHSGRFDPKLIKRIRIMKTKKKWLIFSIGFNIIL